MLPGCSEAAGDLRGKDKTCYMNEELLQPIPVQNSRPHGLAQRRIECSSPIQNRWDQLIGTKTKTSLRIHIPIHIISMFAVVTRQGLKISVRLLVMVRLHCQTPVTWLSLMCSRPQQHWCHDACGVSCCCGMSPKSAPEISTNYSFNWLTPTSQQ